MRNSRAGRAFTFVEILVALAFMAIVIPVVFQAITLANTVSTRAVRKREAEELANRKLNEIVAEEAWQDGDASGDFEDDAPGFTWASTVADWTDDTMTRITVSVTYKVQGTEFTESLTTIVPTETEDAS